MVLYVLVVWFGVGNTQSSFAVPALPSKVECARLGEVMKRRYGAFTAVDCYPYRGR